MDEELREKQLSRLDLAGITMPEEDKLKYLEQPDDLGEFTEGTEIPEGYKKCGGCKRILKLYMFNVNNAAKNKCTGNCKACQKVSAANSYEKTKGNRDYKEYYAKNRDRKLASGKKYYEENKEKVTDTQKQYHQSKKGRKVMQKAHAKRRKLMAEHKGIPYKREYVIERDKLGGEFPVCYICGEPIKYEREIQLDHLIGITIGGQDCFTNVACTHMVCNLKKTKACTETTVEQVEDIIARAETYIDEHPELFAE